MQIHLSILLNEILTFSIMRQNLKCSIAEKSSIIIEFVIKSNNLGENDYVWDVINVEEETSQQITSLSVLKYLLYTSRETENRYYCQYSLQKTCMC